MVRPLQAYLTAELMATKKLTTNVMNVIKVLALVENANQVCRLLPPEAFYNELIRCAHMPIHSLLGNRQKPSVSEPLV